MRWGERGGVAGAGNYLLAIVIHLAEIKDCQRCCKLIESLHWLQMQRRITCPLALRLHPPSCPCSFMPQARASNTSNMLTPISRHPAAHAACCCLLPPACCLLFVVACCLAMLPKSYCQALTATRQPTDSQTDSPRGQRRRGNIESNSIDVDGPCGQRGKGGATVVRRLVQHFSITSLCNVFCSHFSSLCLSLLQSFAYFLSLLQVQRSEFPFLFFPFWGSSWRNQTHYVQSVEALSMILLYSAPLPSFFFLFFHLLFVFCAFASSG